MTVGEKIKKIRTLLNLTQKELGIKSGFSTSTADVRIRQYESNKMVPKPEKLSQIATSLNVDVSALSDIDIKSIEDIMHILFELEEYYGLDIKKQDSGYKLTFNQDVTPKELLYALDTWYNTKQELINNAVENENELKYKIWKLRYPLDTKEKELNEQNAMLKIYKKDISVMNNIQLITFKDIAKIFEDMIKSKINIEFASLHIADCQQLAIFSFSNSQLLSLDEPASQNFVNFLYAIDTLKALGMQIELLTHSNHNDTFSDYYIHNNQVSAMVSSLEELKHLIDCNKLDDITESYRYKNSLKSFDVPIKNYV